MGMQLRKEPHWFRAFDPPGLSNHHLHIFWLRGLSFLGSVVRRFASFLLQIDMPTNLSISNPKTITIIKIRRLNGMSSGNHHARTSSLVRDALCRLVEANAQLIRAINAGKKNGLVMYSNAPCSSPVTISFSWPLAESMITGILPIR